ncbi:MAG: hypothetical protein HQM13_16790 [SAR324 cluster bacterium]|nr:hypothetical protein [SAR324 cluster bacterium]
MGQNENDTKFSDDSSPPDPGKEKAGASPRILLVLPEDLFKTYQDRLRERFSALECDVTLAKPDVTKTDHFDRVISFSYVWDSGTEEPLSADSKDPLFRIEGIPESESNSSIEAKALPLAPVEERLIALKKNAMDQENSSVIVKLIHHHHVLQYQLQKLSKLQLEIQQIDQQISAIDEPYYQDLNYIFLEAVEKISGISFLQEQNIMKGLMKILLIDGLEKKTVDGLIPLGYFRKNLSTMSIHDLKSKYDEFLIEQKNLNPSVPISLKKFLEDSRELAPFEIIYINQWNFKKGKLPVQLRIKKKTIISKEEKRLEEKDPQALEEQIAPLEKKQEELRSQLQQSTAELEKAELTRELSEEKYQTLIKQRKRILGNLKKTILRLKKFQRPSTNPTEIIFYTRGLIQTFREHQSAMDSFRETLSSWHQVGGFLSDYMGPPSSISQLKKMLNLATLRYQLELTSEKMKKQIPELKEKMESFAQNHQLWEEEYGYQAHLDQFFLDRLERAVLVHLLSPNSPFFH